VSLEETFGTAAEFLSRHNSFLTNTVEMTKIVPASVRKKGVGRIDPSAMSWSGGTR
jgi:hypothetical protein